MKIIIVIIFLAISPSPSVCPEGPPERPPPLPDGTVKARDEPFGRGELCQSSVVCHVSPPHVSLFGLFAVLV